MARVTAYIDYGSPYSYQAWYRVMHNGDRYPANAFDWVPVSAGHLFAQDGGKPNASYPNMYAYNRRDLERWAQGLDIPYKMNPVFPQRTIDASRVHYALRAGNPAAATAWSAAVFRAHWVDGLDVSQMDTLNVLATKLRLGDASSLAGQPEAKKALIEATGAAYQAGAPGVPYFVVDGEGYWGHDRLDWVLARLRGADAPQFP